MVAKTTGAQFKRFYNDAAFWGEDTFHDDAVICVNGEPQPDGVDDATLADADVVTIEGGVVENSPLDSREYSLESYFKKWLRTQTVQSFLVECDASVLDAVKAAIKAAGGKVV